MHLGNPPPQHLCHRLPRQRPAQWRFESSRIQAPGNAAGLQGLMDGQQGQVLVPDCEAMAVISRLAQGTDSAVASAARQLLDGWAPAN